MCLCCYAGPLSLEISCSPADLQGRDGSDTRFFMCDPGSLRFLASNEFDFNKWIYKGISFAPLSRRRGLLMRMAQNSSEGDTPTLVTAAQRMGPAPK